MADIAQLMETFLSTERRLTTIEHRLEALEKKPAKPAREWPKLSPKLWLGLLVAALSAAQTLRLEDGLKILSRLF